MEVSHTRCSRELAELTITRTNNNVNIILLQSIRQTLANLENVRQQLLPCIGRMIERYCTFDQLLVWILCKELTRPINSVAETNTRRQHRVCMNPVPLSELLR